MSSNSGVSIVWSTRTLQRPWRNLSQEKRKCGGGLLAMTLAPIFCLPSASTPPPVQKRESLTSIITAMALHGCCAGVGRVRGMPSRYRQVYHVFRQGPRLCQCKSSRLGIQLQLEAGIAARSCSPIPREFIQLQQTVTVAVTVRWNNCRCIGSS